MNEIKFGTDGWRGVIADDYTCENVRRVAGAIAAYVLKHEDSRRGVMIGVELVKNQKTREPYAEARNKVIYRAFEQGLLLLGCGESTVRLMPPLVVDQEQADYAIEVLERCISELAE